MPNFMSKMLVKVTFFMKFQVFRTVADCKTTVVVLTTNLHVRLTTHHLLYQLATSLKR